jgi:hypothetical protein
MDDFSFNTQIVIIAIILLITFPFWGILVFVEEVKGTNHVY